MGDGNMAAWYCASESVRSMHRSTYARTRKLLLRLLVTEASLIGSAWMPIAIINLFTPTSQIITNRCLCELTENVWECKLWLVYGMSVNLRTVGNPDPILKTDHRVYYSSLCCIYYILRPIFPLLHHQWARLCTESLMINNFCYILVCQFTRVRVRVKVKVAWDSRPAQTLRV